MPYSSTNAVLSLVLIVLSSFLVSTEGVEKKLVIPTAKAGICPAPLIKVIQIPDDGVSEDRGNQGPSSIFLANDNLFYQDGQAGPLQAFDTTTLKRLWMWPPPRRVPASVTRGWITFGYGDPNNFYEWEINFCTATEDVIVVRSSNYRTGQYFVSGIDITTGKELWRADELSNQKSIIVDGLLIPTEGNLTGYEIQSGQVKWQLEYDYEKRKITKHIIDEKKAEKKTILYPLIWGADDKIFSIDAYSGQILWMETPIQELRTGFAYSDGDGGFGYVVTEPVDNIVCFCHQMRHSTSVLIAFDVKKRSVLWEYRDCPDPYFVHDNGDVVITRPGPVGKRGLVCLDAKTGKEKWECILSSLTMGFTVSDKVIYCWDRKPFEDVFEFWEGNVYAINRITGKIVWRYKSYDYFIGSPVLYKDKVYVLSTKREEDHNGIIRIFDHKATLEAIKQK